MPRASQGEIRLNIDEIRPRSLLERQQLAYEEDVRHYQALSRDFVHRNCPACDADAAAPFVEKDGFRYVRCRACWCIFMSPGPTDEHLSWLYSEGSANYRFWADEMYPKTRVARSQRLHLPRALWVQRSINDFGPMPSSSRPRCLLEFGAGTGDTLNALAQTEPSLDLLGFEPNPLMHQAWATSVELIREESRLTALGDSLACITAFEVIEHLLSPSVFFLLARDLLEPGGLLMVSTPNAASLEIQMLKAESPSIDIEHISIMSPSALASLARRANLDVVEITTPGDFDLELINDSPVARGLFGFPPGQIIGANHAPESLQREIAQGGMSGHMKAIFRRP